MSDCNLVEELLEDIDCVLGIRDEIGAIKHKVYFLTRTWDGERIGDGSVTEEKEILWPTPYLVDLSHNIKLMEAGYYKQGDLLLKDISKRSYPDEAVISRSSEDENIEMFYSINDHTYTVIQVVEKYLTWDVQIRKISHEGAFDKED